MSDKHVHRAYKLFAATSSAAEFKVLICLCFSADETGSVDRVPASWGFTHGYKPSALKAVLASLVKHGLIERKVVKQGRGKSDYTTITLSLEKYAKLQQRAKFHSGVAPRRKPARPKAERPTADQLSLL